MVFILKTHTIFLRDQSSPETKIDEIESHNCKTYIISGPRLTLRLLDHNESAAAGDCATRYRHRRYEQRQSRLPRMLSSNVLSVFSVQNDMGSIAFTAILFFSIRAASVSGAFLASILQYIEITLIVQVLIAVNKNKLDFQNIRNYRCSKGP